MHRVYMRFDLWRVTLTAPGTSLREFTFADRDKVEEMAKRGGARRTLADVQGLKSLSATDAAASRPASRMNKSPR